jgi:hypothetical protein
VADQRDVLGVDDRAGAGQPGERGKSAPEHDGEVHVGGLAGRGAVAVEAVGMAVHHPESQGPTGHSRPRKRAREQAAVAAEHERALAAAQTGGGCVAERL